MGNKTTVTNTTIGGAIAVVIVAVLGYFGVNFTPEVAGSLVAALTIIINYFLPEKLTKK